MELGDDCFGTISNKKTEECDLYFINFDDGIYIPTWYRGNQIRKINESEEN